MNESYKTTLIKIMGEEYPIKSDADSEYMQMLARHVEEQIQGISTKIKLPPHLKPEILAALLIADEYFNEKQKNAEIDQKLNKLMLVLEENF
jgi:cell division protein ZapA (FtsZ GTPase activity inhibitor)